MPHSGLTDQVFPHNYRFEDGYLVMDEVPGLGVDIDETLAAKYPYERAYLPVARLQDGSTVGTGNPPPVALRNKDPVC
ncbi:hypothetical protein ACTMU2_34170 [Cupriavidus basilensis]